MAALQKIDKAQPGVLARWLVCGLLVIFVSAVQQGRTFASSVRAMDLQEMAALADRIVHARCTGTQAEWRGEKIFTQATFTVTSALKGSSEPLVITSLGGTAVHPVLGTSVTMQVAGGVTFASGDEVVVFTARNRNGQNQVVGLSMGNYKVQTDAVSGKKRVHSEYKELRVQPSSAAATGTQIDAQNMELESFLSQVRKAISTDTAQADR